MKGEVGIINNKEIKPLPTCKKGKYGWNCQVCLYYKYLYFSFSSCNECWS